MLSSLSNSKITRIGSVAQGIFYFTLDKKLPNGWEYQLSNEVYQDLDGKNYENIGIIPEYIISYLKNKDLFFDKLIGELKNKRVGISTRKRVSQKVIISINNIKIKYLQSFE